jgi:hypothetical protein
MSRDKMVVYDYMDKFPHCEVSNKWCGNMQPHHIQSVGAGGPDEDWNLIRLSKNLHKEVHLIGNKQFCIKYKNCKIKNVLERLGQWTEKDEERFNEGNCNW